MLPSKLLPTVTRTAIAGVMALSLAAAAATPAQAGKNEDNFLKGVAAALVVGAIVKNMQANRAAPQPAYRQTQPTYVQPGYGQPRYPQQGYQPVQPAYGKVIGGSQTGYTSIHATAAAQAFNSYSLTERRTIQQRLAAMGYYRSGIDGSFGPGTYNAVTAYARDMGASDRLSSREGAFGVYDGLIY